ncbi:helix-turn-helix domain-containing protein [Streptomyces violaceusniger]|uniref:helix-turn-helix domain-containing protein n=1 Tax=Streptomyces violaceusniger TaxID=68280 RepID=UPI003CD0BFB7
MGNAKEVEDFAERLRALKERSGRSYGSLATRLHVSTSTLHRYCNGDAVPADYAPVERFARLCGATPDELVALHRRWILADAAKRRAREGAMSAPRGGEDAAGGPAADGTERRTDARSGGGEPRQSADVRGADAASDAAGTTAKPAAPPAADRHQGRVSTPGPGPVTGPHPDVATATGRAGDSGSGPEAGARSRDAQPGGAGDERHDAAAPADASRATPMSDAHPAARRASAAADPASGRPGNDNGPDRSAQAHGTAHRGAAAHPNGDPHQCADATDRADGTLTDSTRTQPPGASTADAESPATEQAQPPRPCSPATGRANNPRPQPPDAPTAETGPTPTAEAEPTAAGETGPPPAKRALLRAVAASTTDTATGSPVRRPWALLAGAAAVVVLAVTAVEVRPPGEDGRKDTAAAPPSAAPSSTPPAGPTARGHLDRQKTDGDKESGAPRRDGGKDERGKERRAEGDASGSPAPGATKGTDHGGSGSTQVPLTLSTRSHVWENGCGHRYLIDRSPAQVAPPPTEQDAPTWAAAHGAVHGGTTNVEVTVQGRASSAVVLQALHVRVVGRRTPLAWSSFAMDNGCGGSLTPRAFSVNLDAARPLARPTDGNDAGKPIPAVRFPYRVSASDPEVLLVNARTAGCDCSWYLELDWTSGGRSGTVRIDDHGSPFRTSSVKGRPAYAYDYTDGTWHKSD